MLATEKTEVHEHGEGPGCGGGCEDDKIAW